MDPRNSLVQSNIVLLEQALELLARLDDATFTRRSRRSGTVGAQLRHILDHYGSLLGRRADRAVDYDARRRDPRVESDRAAAAELVWDCLDRLETLDLRQLDQPLAVHADDGGADGGAWARSSLRRELQFLLSHTVHHYALIHQMLEPEGVDLGDEFGVAPSTLRYRRQEKVARSDPRSRGGARLRPSPTARAGARAPVAEVSGPTGGANGEAGVARPLQAKPR